MDPHSFFANPNPVNFLNVDPDPDPAAFKMRTRIQLKRICEKLPFKEFSGDEKDKIIVQKYKNHGADLNLL